MNIRRAASRQLRPLALGFMLRLVLVLGPPNLGPDTALGSSESRSPSYAQSAGLNGEGTAGQSNPETSTVSQTRDSVKIEKVVAVLGLENVRPNAKGVLTIRHGDVEFQSGAFSTQVHSASISEVSVDPSSRKLVGGKAGTVVKFAAPFGTGTLISLLREAIDIVAIKYSDADGGLHGAIFALPKGQATAVKEGLIAGEARRSMPVQFGVGVQRGSPGQLLPVSPGESRHKFSPVAIQIEQVESGHANLPPEFSIASYEKLVEEVQRTKKFRYVYRSGDRRAGSVPHLVVLRVEVESFKKGNERERELTMVAGATVITASAQMCTRDGVPLVQGKRTGKGENLEAAGKLAKNVAKLVRQTL